MSSATVFSKSSKDQKPRKRILVVDDEAFWVELLKLELQGVHAELEVVHAANGEEAVELIKRSYSVDGKSGMSLEEPPSDEEKPHYDVIITDILMPVMDGCTAVKIIRDLFYVGPIIVWSSRNDSAEALEKALDIPVNGFCTKESTLHNLLIHLRNLKVIA